MAGNDYAGITFDTFCVVRASDPLSGRRLHRGLAAVRDRGTDRRDRSLARLASFPASLQRYLIRSSVNYSLIDPDQFSSPRIARDCCALICGIAGSDDGAGTRGSDRDCRRIYGLCRRPRMGNLGARGVFPGAARHSGAGGDARPSRGAGQGDPPGHIGLAKRKRRAVPAAGARVPTWLS